jgi:hypothetical protein
MVLGILDRLPHSIAFGHSLFSHHERLLVLVTDALDGLPSVIYFSWVQPPFLHQHVHPFLEPSIVWNIHPLSFSRFSLHFFINIIHSSKPNSIQLGNSPSLPA